MIGGGEGSRGKCVELMTLKKRFLGGNPVFIFVIFVFHAYTMWNLLDNLYIGVYQLILEC